jgi:hypothetical protein
MPKSVEKKLECAFCGKPKDQVARLIAGPGVYICNICVNGFETSAQSKSGSIGACSFCGQDMDRGMTSASKAAICSKCIELCNEIINNELFTSSDNSKKSRLSTNDSKSAPETSREALVNILANSALINACAMHGSNIDAEEVQAEFSKRLKELGMDPDKLWCHPQGQIDANLYPQILLSQMNNGLRLIATRLSAIEKKLEMIEKEN